MRTGLPCSAVVAREKPHNRLVRHSRGGKNASVRPKTMHVALESLDMCRDAAGF